MTKRFKLVKDVNLVTQRGGGYSSLFIPAGTELEVEEVEECGHPYLKRVNGGQLQCTKCFFVQDIFDELCLCGTPKRKGGHSADTCVRRTPEQQAIYAAKSSAVTSNGSKEPSGSTGSMNPAKTEKWRPTLYSVFWYVTEFGSIDTAFVDIIPSYNRKVMSGNCFPFTPEGKAQAEAVAEKFKKLFQ